MLDEDHVIGVGHIDLEVLFKGRFSDTTLAIIMNVLASATYVFRDPVNVLSNRSPLRSASSAPRSTVSSVTSSRPAAVICWKEHRPAPWSSVINRVMNKVTSERMQNNQQPAATPRFPRLGRSQVWMRFLLAVAGLMLAFGTALFSTVAREAGNIWGTI